MFIGRVIDGEKLELDLPTLVDTRLLIQANSGGGKSWLLRLIAERGGIQTIVLVNVLRPESTSGPVPGIHVKVLNIQNRNGTVDCALFDSPAGFPREFLHSAQNVMVRKIRNTTARCDFEAIPPGTYALAIIHDE